jgi:Skp family chaperone for outer membrane proteins
MIVQMIDTLRSAIQLVISIYALKHQLDENQHSARRLADRVEIFRSILNKLAEEMSDKKQQQQQQQQQQQKEEEDLSLQKTVQMLHDVLKEIEAYLRKLLKGGSLYGKTKRMVLNVAFRKTITGDLSGFNQRG